jgi:hypothetical protein
MVSETICSACQYENEDSALVCSNCGALLDNNPTRLVSIPNSIDAKPTNAAAFIDVALIPEDGIGVYAEGSSGPYYVSIYRELIIGRADAAMEAVLDLPDVDTYNMGLSRRHAVLRRTKFGFDIIDLSSRNGTWLNGEQLIPNKPYPFASGSQIRLGRMRLTIVYHVPGKDRQK